MVPALPNDEAVRAEVERVGLRVAFEQLIAESDARLRGPVLDNGRELSAARCAIYRGVIAAWAERQERAFGYDRPFAVVALGGTGRHEMTPCSDTDFAFLFDDAIDRNPFLAHLQEQTIHSGNFMRECGFNGVILPFNLDEMPTLRDKQLNAFIDMDPVYDPEGLAVRFRERIRASYDPFEHFLHISSAWRAREKGGDYNPENLASFDIKNDGLRVFLAGVWSLGGVDFRHSHEIYAEMADPRSLEAYYFLLRIRAHIHLRRGTRQPPTATGNHPEDLLEFDDFLSFGEMLPEGAGEEERFEFANKVRGQLLTARRRVEQFTRGVIGGILKKGRPIGRGSAIVLGTGGLCDTSLDRGEGREKSRAALKVLRVAQRYQLPIDPSSVLDTFHQVGDWLEPVPEVSELFYEPRGSLADSLGFLAQLPGATERIFPGFSKFESSVDERVLTERSTLRGVFVRAKIRSLERDLAEGLARLERALKPDELTDPEGGTAQEIEAALLDGDHLCAVKLALQTKRLPLTPSDLVDRENTSLPLHERYSRGFSGIPLSDYYKTCFKGCGFSEETLKIAQFLVANRVTLRNHADHDLMSPAEVNALIATCGDNEMRLRALFVFTVADRSTWESEESEPARWFLIRELYRKARMRYRSPTDLRLHLSQAGFDRGEMDILHDFGRTFYGGSYRPYALKFGSYLLRLAADSPDDTGRWRVAPRVEKVYIGASAVIAVAARDHPGMAASISGALWQHNVALSQAHLFSATAYRLALDFFHLAPSRKAQGLPRDVDLPQAICDAIVEQRFISEADEAALPRIARNLTLEPTASGLYRLRAETECDVGGLVYFLTCKAYRQLRANIYGLAAHTGDRHVWVSVYLGMANGMSEEQGRDMVGQW